MNELIQNLSGIGGFITSLITLFTLIVLIKQRRDSFRPKVVFGDRMYAKCKPKKDNLVKSRWIEDYKEDNDENFFCFEMLNAGIGIAENVVVKESFDLEKAAAFIRKLDSKRVFQFDFKEDSIEISTSFDNTYFIIFREIFTRELGTFLPIGHHEKRRFIFNDSLLSFLSCYDYLISNNEDRTALADFPHLKIELGYCDLEGKKYKSHYECHVSSVLKDSYSFVYVKKS